MVCKNKQQQNGIDIIYPYLHLCLSMNDWCCCCLFHFYGYYLQIGGRGFIFICLFNWEFGFCISLAYHSLHYDHFPFRHHCWSRCCLLYWFGYSIEHRRDCNCFSVVRKGVLNYLSPKSYWNFFRRDTKG